MARALEVIPRTLIQNVEADELLLIDLRAKHDQSDEFWTWGVDGETGECGSINVFPSCREC